RSLSSNSLGRVRLLCLAILETVWNLNMADLTLQERLQPSLLDRLIDDAPHHRQEPRDDRVLSLDRLREAVQRDLAWLLNTVNLEATEDLGEYPYIARSVL